MHVAHQQYGEAATAIAVLGDLDASAHRPHALHGPVADWPEKNCYADLWIEALAALGLDPCAMLGHTVAVDFAGDQWTFYKPCHAELRELYGVDVQELTVWRPMEDHALEHVAAGRFVCTEADAFWLPDTRGTDYRRQHTKTTIMINAIDPRSQRLGYFHNAGYFELHGEDYVRLLRVGAQPDPEFMPLFAELVHVQRRVQRDNAQLSGRALALLRAHYEWRPQANPFTRFGERFVLELPAIRDAGLAHYHAWAFASVRQAGSGFELAAAHLRWLAAHGHPKVEEAAQHFAAISAGCKSLILRAARAAMGKPFDPLPPTAAMARSWDLGMAALGGALG